MPNQQTTNPGFKNWSDEQVEQYLLNQGFLACRKLKDGDWIGVMPLMFTTSVCCGMAYISAFQYRWCFQDPNEAWLFFNTCSEVDEVPEHRSSLRGHRYPSSGPLHMEYDELGLKKW